MKGCLLIVDYINFTVLSQVGGFQKTEGSFCSHKNNLHDEYLLFLLDWWVTSSYLKFVHLMEQDFKKQWLS